MRHRAALKEAQAVKQQLPRALSVEQWTRGFRLLSKTKQMLLVLRQRIPFGISAPMQCGVAMPSPPSRANPVLLSSGTVAARLPLQHVCRRSMFAAAARQNALLQHVLQPHNGKFPKQSACYRAACQGAADAEAATVAAGVARTSAPASGVKPVWAHVKCKVTSNLISCSVHMRTQS